MASMETTKATMQPISRGRDLGQGEHAAFGQELDQLEARSTCHNGNSQEEGELGSSRAAHTAKQTANDGGTAAGSAGNQSQYLPGTHDEGLLVGDAAQLGSGGHAGRRSMRINAIP